MDDYDKFTGPSGAPWTLFSADGELPGGRVRVFCSGANMSKVILFLSVTVLAALSLTACQRHRRSEVVVGGHALAATARLVCPDHQGPLTRVALAPDGQACTYSGPDGEEVSLVKVGLAGTTSQSVLQAREHELAALLPAPPALQRSDNSIASDQAGGGGSRRDDAEGTRIDLPGLHIHTDGDRASVRLPGVNINANGDNAHISTGMGELKNATIDAQDGAVRITSNMTDAENLDQTWLVATDKTGPAGWRFVGYAARGPLSGPLVVATFRSRAEHAHSGDRQMEDIRHLVSLSLK